MASAKPAGYKLATYKSSEGPRAGLIVGEDVFDAAKLTGKPAYATVTGHSRRLEGGRGRAEKGRRRGGEKPGQAAAAEKDQIAGADPGQRRDLLRRRQLRRSRRGHGGAGGQSAAARSAHPGAEAVSLPQGAGHHCRIRARPIKISHYAKAMDWEIELAAVIGRPAKDVPKEKALSYVAGYMVSNDLSARDRGRRDGVAPTSPFKMDWLKHKTFEGSCPIGPWIVPASDIPDPQNLGLKLWVNGELKQDSNTAKMLFTLAEQIEQLSVNMTLHPGDLILTGTPSGTGAESGTFLKAGDVVKLWIEKVGEIENRMA